MLNTSPKTTTQLSLIDKVKEMLDETYLPEKSEIVDIEITIQVKTPLGNGQVIRLMTPELDLSCEKFTQNSFHKSYGIDQ